MDIRSVKSSLLLADAEVLVVGVPTGEKRTIALPLPEETIGEVGKVVAQKHFNGTVGETLVLSVPSHPGKHLVLAGIGDVAKLQHETLREVMGSALSVARGLGAASVAIGYPESTAVTPQEVGQAFAEAAHMWAYKYSAYKQPSKERVELATVIIACKDGRVASLVAKGLEKGRQIIEGVTLTRNLVNAPPHEMHPEELAKVAKDIAKRSKGVITVKVLDAEACEKLGMGAYLAVAKGSDFPPKFIHLTYTPSKKAKKKVAVVGKGITFDSGGLSIKPADAMMTMKCDMAGAAAVLGFFNTLAAVAPSVEVHGIIAACENMPSGKAMRPGDICRASNGKTIEILNTDAEGRLTLADALTYAVKLKPDAIIDLATLTGACVVALGEEITGLMGNNEDLSVDVLAAAARAGEKMWEMPLEKRYRSLVESDVADLRNIATSRYGGSLTAGLFLQEFVENTPWVHLDIAGPAFAERPMASYIGRGGTGHGVRTLIELVQHMK